MEYTIRYKSTNLYESPTPEVCLDFLILPANFDGRNILDYKVKTTPKHRFSVYENKYGFKVMRFMNLSNLLEFTLEMQCTVKLENTPPPVDPQFETKSAEQVLQSNSFLRFNHFFLQNTKLTQLNEGTTLQYERAVGTSVFSYLMELKNHVYKLMEYVPGVTDITTSAQNSIDAGKGVCQDFSHIFIGICRHSGIPARYVSGYLNLGHDAPAQLHAWVEALVPGIGWIGIDPTNHLLTNENYIKIAHGIDYSECPSIRGIIRGAINHTTKYEVAIQQQSQ